MKYARWIKLYCILCILGVLLTQQLSAKNTKKRVLVLHAYHQGFHWTDRIMAGIQSVFDERNDIELFINYMDTKRRSDPAYLEQLRALYATKYQLVKFDAIISTDDHALDFLLQYRDQLFPDTPVIFSGLNAFPENRLNGQKQFTGIYESYDIAGTIELMLSLHPETKTITAVTDGTRSGKIFKQLLEKAALKFSNKVKITHLHNLSLDSLQMLLKSLPEKSLVLWAIYVRTPSGVPLTSEESVALVSSSSRFPTYCVWDVVGQGVVGGKITSPNYQGETAAKMTMRVLQGESIENIPVVGSPLVNIFDFNLMQQFNIPISKIPSPNIILNKPDSLYERYKQYIWLVAIIFIFLVIIIIFLITILVLKRKRDQYEGMAMRDQLTGLHNRYYLQEMAFQKLSEANRHQYPLCLLVLDLDRFKAINDTRGHPVGDIVLKKLALLLDEQNRIEDIVARIGGEEFVILLNHCDADEAIKKAQSLRIKIAELNPHNIAITVSIGVAELSPKGETFEQLLERADAAVYRAKDQGRNCVVI
jgi:diguanylate cyclase (GGDEF)-like protein